MILISIIIYDAIATATGTGNLKVLVDSQTRLPVPSRLPAEYFDSLELGPCHPFDAAKLFIRLAGSALPRKYSDMGYVALSRQKSLRDLGLSPGQIFWSAKLLEQHHNSRGDGGGGDGDDDDYDPLEQIVEEVRQPALKLLDGGGGGSGSGGGGVGGGDVDTAATAATAFSHDDRYRRAVSISAAHIKQKDPQAFRCVTLCCCVMVLPRMLSVLVSRRIDESIVLCFVTPQAHASSINASVLQHLSS